MGNPEFLQGLRRQLEPGAGQGGGAEPGTRALRRQRGNAFSDGEIQVEIGENVRGTDTFIIQSTSPDVNHNLMELLIMADALKRSSAGIHRRGHPVLRVRPAGPEGGSARPHHRQAGGRPHRGRRRHPRGLDGHARRADPGVLQHPLRPPLRRAHHARAHEEAVHRPREPGHRLARRRRRGARPGLLEAHGLRAGHRRQAAHQGQRGRDHERHRRREGQGRHPARRHDRHRRHAHAGRQPPSRRRGRRRSSPTPPMRCSPGRRSSGSPGAPSRRWW